MQSTTLVKQNLGFNPTFIKADVKKFLLSGVVQDGTERGRLGLKDDAKVLER